MRPVAVLRAWIDVMIIQTYAGKRRWERVSDTTFQISISRTEYLFLQHEGPGIYTIWCSKEAKYNLLSGDDLFQPVKELWEVVARNQQDPYDPLLNFLNI